MTSKFIIHKNKAIALRKRGFTYGEIKKSIGVQIPKSTLTVWFKNIRISKNAKMRLDKVIGLKLKNAHLCALEVNRKRRQEYLSDVTSRVAHLKKRLNDTDVAKISLAMLYLGEGTKSRRGDMLFANSDSHIITLFLKLLRKCYLISEDKFRCTVQCRADQDILKLEEFWSRVTKVPLKQFYKTRVDPRTVGKKSKKPDYKGVCCINYFSADVFNEIKIMMDIICYKGP